MLAFESCLPATYWNEVHQPNEVGSNSALNLG